jgi:peptidyl-prolyl cis-trans isomerase SurA
MTMMMRKWMYILLGASMSMHVSAQSLVIDRVVGIVGDFNILQSDIEQQYLQMKMSGRYMEPDVKCNIFNYFVEQKLLLAQAKIDSIEVGPAMVEMQMEARLDYFVSQFGNEAEMEAYFNKSIFDIKDDLREAIGEQMLTEQVRNTITEDVSTTPSDVKRFYRSMDPDSIPLVNTQVQLAQIVAYPNYSDEAIFLVKERLLELRKRVQEGEDFGTLAILYSEAPEAARRGEIGFLTRNELDKAYADAAWALKPGQVSKIVESSFGYHIIQMIERRGDRINTRHILMNPKADANAKQKALHKLDSLKTVIENDSASFEFVAKWHSEDPKTSVNGGLIVNPNTMASRFELDELDTKNYYHIRNMEVGDVSEPFESTDHNYKICYKLLHLKSRTEPHRANLKQDYLLLQGMALQQKNNEVMQQWYEDKKATTYIKIGAPFRDCPNQSQQITQK